MGRRPKKTFLQRQSHQEHEKMPNVAKHKTETIKLLEENIGKTLSDINHSRILYDPPPRVMEIKAKINKWGLIKLKSFCTMKETNITLQISYTTIVCVKRHVSREKVR